MKNLIISLLLVMLPLLAFTQTRELEKNYLNNIIFNKKATKDEAAALGLAWRDLLTEFGGYPELPYNTETGKIEFITTIEVPGKSKAEIIRRLEEWVAINYGSINEVLHYKNLESGKMIVKGLFDMPFEVGEYDWFWSKKLIVRNSRCHHTVIFTVRDGKLKMEHQDMEFRYRTEGYVSSNVYVPSENVEIPVGSLYPVTAGAKDTWKSRLRTIQEIIRRTKLSEDGLKSYLLNADKYDQF